MATVSLESLGALITRIGLMDSGLGEIQQGAIFRSATLLDNDLHRYPHRRIP